MTIPDTPLPDRAAHDRLSVGPLSGIGRSYHERRPTTSGESGCIDPLRPPQIVGSIGNESQQALTTAITNGLFPPHQPRSGNYPPLSLIRTNHAQGAKKAVRPRSMFCYTCRQRLGSTLPRSLLCASPVL